MVSAGGADAPWFGEDAVPCVTANVDDVVERVEEAVRQEVVAHELPELLDGVEFRAVGRQPDERDVVRDGEVGGDVLAGAVDQDGGMGAGGDRLAEFGEQDVHRLGRGPRQDDSDAGIAVRADGAEEVGRLETMVANRPGTGAGRRPAPGQRAFLTDPGLVLEPDLQRCCLGMLEVAPVFRTDGEERSPAPISS